MPNYFRYWPWCITKSSNVAINCSPIHTWVVKSDKTSEICRLSKVIWGLNEKHLVFRLLVQMSQPTLFALSVYNCMIFKRLKNDTNFYCTITREGVRLESYDRNYHKRTCRLINVILQSSYGKWQVLIFQTPSSIAFHRKQKCNLALKWAHPSVNVADPLKSRNNI